MPTPSALRPARHAELIAASRDRLGSCAKPCCSSRRDGKIDSVRRFSRALVRLHQLQAAIVACHAESPSWEQTDWLQILLLYDELIRRAGTPVTRLHRAVALRYVAGPEQALDEIESLEPALSGHHLLHATRAALLRDLGRLDEARVADRQALVLTSNPAERALLEQRLA